MDSKEFIFVMAFTLVAGLCCFFISGIVKDIKSKHTTLYLRNKRTEILRYSFPGCQYKPEGSASGKSIMEQYSSGNTYVRDLGYMTFSGRYEGFQMDDAITEYSTRGSDNASDFYESLLFQYHIPTDSPVYQLGYMNVRRVGKAKVLVGKAVTTVKEKILSIDDGSDGGRTKYFQIGNTGIEAVIPSGPAGDRWIMLLGQSLSEKIEVLFRMYDDASHIEMAYDNDKLYMCVCIRLGYDEKFVEKNDFVIRNIELISRTMIEIEGLCTRHGDRSRGE